MILSDAAIKNRTTIGVLVLLIVVSGATSYVTLPREGPPDVNIPIVIITTVYEGVSPANVEAFVTMKIEAKLSGMTGVKEIRSSSAEGVSTITVEFTPDIDIDDALQYVRDKVDLAKSELKPEVEEPTIKEVNVAEFPIMMVNLTGPISLVRLKDIADRLEEEIEQNIPGVLNVDVLGGLEREIRLEPDHDKVVSYGLTIAELLQFFPSEHVNISAGTIDTPGMKFNVRLQGEFVNPEEVDEIVVAVRGDKPVYFSDVADINDTFKDRMSYSRLGLAGGSKTVESVTLSIQKRVGADILPIAAAVRAILAEAKIRTPKGVEFLVTFDQSKEIRMMVSDLENNILSGLLLVLAVLILFMGWRTSMIVALAIPLSMLMSFAVIQLLGLTLNMIVLFSLIMALGMLVDNAIVIVENIYRYMEMGHDRLHAAMKATSEVAWPVITSTATTVAAFAPLIFWPGIMGDFMKYLPITLIITLCSSLFVAMIISPTVCSLMAGGRRKKKETRGSFVRRYASMLNLALENRAVTLTLSALLLVGTGILFGKFNKGVELFPEMDPNQGIVNIRCPQGTNIEETDRLAGRIEKRVLDSIGGDLDYLVTNVGSSGGGASMFGGSSGGQHVANLMLTFYDFDTRKRKSAEALKDLRDALTDIAGAEIKVEKPQEGPPTGAPITIRIIGKEFKKLRKISKQVEGLIKDTPGLINLSNDFEGARPELSFQTDRRRARLLGVNTAVVGNFLKTALFGQKVGTYRQFNDEYDITIRLPKDQRSNLDDILRWQVPNKDGKAVPLSSLGSFDYTGGYGTINRLNKDRVVTVSADNAEGVNTDELLKTVQKKLKGLKIEEGYKIKYAGQKEEQEKAMAFLSKAFVVAIFLIVMILVTQFNTLSAPLIITTTVILSLIGVMAGLLICRMPFGVIMTGVGVISLAGVVVNNAIVLLEYTRQLQRKGLDLIPAVVRAGTTRLRPVLLTAATTILGLIPMATGVSFNFRAMVLATRSESSQWWASMAIVVIFGLAFATILTLVIVPTLYASLYKLAAWFGYTSLKRPDGDEQELTLEDY